MDSCNEDRYSGDTKKVRYICIYMNRQIYVYLMGTNDTAEIPRSLDGQINKQRDRQKDRQTDRLIERLIYFDRSILNFFNH